MNANQRTTVALCVCAALASAANAGVRELPEDESPFGMQKLAGGFQQQVTQEGTCGEGSCGGDDNNDDGEGSCGEGSCGGDDHNDEAEGSCGEGSCGATDSEGEPEGACGEGSCGGQA